MLQYIERRSWFKSKERYDHLKQLRSDQREAPGCSGPESRAFQHHSTGIKNPKRRFPKRNHDIPQQSSSSASPTCLFKASVTNILGACGLQIQFWPNCLLTSTGKPNSFYIENTNFRPQSLEIKIKEQSGENLVRCGSHLSAKGKHLFCEPTKTRTTRLKHRP